MIKLEDIIHQLNKYIDNIRQVENIDNKSKLVLQKICLQHPTFKAYKDYTITLWNVDCKNKKVVLSATYTDKIIESNENTVFKTLNIQFLNNIFAFISSDNFKKVINGSFIKSTV